MWGRSLPKISLISQEENKNPKFEKMSEKAETIEMKKLSKDSDG